MEEILPPRLEDAGLEDCTLSPKSINLAFLKAANAVGSVLPTAQQLDGDDHPVKCVNDPATAIGKLPDSLPGVPNPEGKSWSDKDVGIPDEALSDGVAYGGLREEAALDTDRLVGVPLPARGRACVAGLEDDIDGFFVGRDGEEEEDQGEEMPILAEACI